MKFRPAPKGKLVLIILHTEQGRVNANFFNLGLKEVGPEADRIELV
jgi:hypothetical protein